MKRVIIISAKLRFILWQDIFLSKPSRWAMLEQAKQVLISFLCLYGFYLIEK